MADLNGQPRRISKAFLLGLSDKPFKDVAPPPPPGPPKPNALGRVIGTPGGLAEWAASDGRRGTLTGSGKARLTAASLAKVPSEKRSVKDAVVASSRSKKEPTEKAASEVSGMLGGWMGWDNPAADTNGGGWVADKTTNNCEKKDDGKGIWTEQQEARLLELNDEGASWDTIATEVGKSQQECQQNFGKIKKASKANGGGKINNGKGKNQNQDQNQHQNRGKKNGGKNNSGGGGRKEEAAVEVTNTWGATDTGDAAGASGDNTAWGVGSWYQAVDGGKKDSSTNQDLWGNDATNTGNDSWTATKDISGKNGDGDGGNGGAAARDTGNTPTTDAPAAWDTNNDATAGGTADGAQGFGSGTDPWAAQNDSVEAGGAVQTFDGAADIWGVKDTTGGTDEIIQGFGNGTDPWAAQNSAVGTGGAAQTFYGAADIWGAKDTVGGAGSYAQGFGNANTNDPWAIPAAASPMFKANSKAPTTKSHPRSHQPSQHASRNNTIRDTSTAPLGIEVRPDDDFSADDLRMIAHILQQDCAMVWNRVSWRFKDKTGRQLHPDVFERKITGRVEGKGSEVGSRRRK